MPPSDLYLSETDIRSEGSKMFTVRSEAGDDRDWMLAAPICTALAEHDIAHLGHGKFPPPFEIVRTQLGGTYFLSCSAGAGTVLIDGRWKPCISGQAFLLSPGTLHAFRASPGRPWEFSWIRFNREFGQNVIAKANSPVLATMEPEQFRHAILGLFHCCRDRPAPAPVGHWIELILLQVRTFAEPDTLDSRLMHLWKEVSRDLSRPWTNAEMAALVHVGDKHLERLCRKELGRTPRQQLIWLRMHRAAELLISSDAKIEQVAEEVGYSNPFTFSTTFRRVTGWPPSRYPGRK